MMPLAFTLENAVEIVPDEQRRALGERARADASAGTFRPPTGVPCTYWGMVVLEHECIVYVDAYRKRTERLARIANKAP